MTISRPSALSINMLMIFIMHDVYGALSVTSFYGISSVIFVPNFDRAESFNVLGIS